MRKLRIKISLLISSILIIGIIFVGPSNFHILGDSTLFAKSGSDNSGNDNRNNSDNSENKSSENSTNNNSGGRKDSDSKRSETNEKESKDDTSEKSESEKESTDDIPIPKPQDAKNEGRIRTTTDTNADEKKTEVRLSETERIRTITKDGKTRVDITSGGIKTRLETRDDRVVIKAEQEDGTEIELEDSTLIKINERLSKDKIKVATAGTKRFFVQKGNAGAITDFPISVDLSTNTVFATTPTGQKTITVLPEQAVQNLLSTFIVNRIGSQKIIDEVNNNNLTSINQIFTLTQKDGIPVYEINGISDQKLFGFIPVKVEKEITVSAQNGDILSTTIPFVSKIIDTFSF